jgi:hypothetical protein
VEYFIMRRVVLLLLALFVVAPVAAQVIIARPDAIQRTEPQVAVPSGNPAQLDVASDPERARAEIARLRARNRELRGQFSTTLADLQALRGQLDEMTRTGGSLVTAYCVGGTVSRNSAGASEDCTASGYTCAAVSGLCHRSCTASSMCARGFACDILSGRCEVPAPAEDD